MSLITVGPALRRKSSTHGPAALTISRAVRTCFFASKEIFRFDMPDPIFALSRQTFRSGLDNSSPLCRINGVLIPPAGSR